MKTIKYISMRVLAIAALALVFAMPAKAQLTDNGYANIDWQFNFLNLRAGAQQHILGLYLLLQCDALFGACQ